MVLVVKNLPAKAGDVRDSGLIPSLEDPLGESMATYSSILAWRMPWPNPHKEEEDGEGISKDL